MAFAKGHYVCTTDKRKKGIVIKVEGAKVTFRTTRGAYFTMDAEPLEKKEGGSYAAYAPDAMELVANSLVFSGTQLVRKRKAFGEPTVRFAITDAAYEFLLKSWLRENVESFISENMHTIQTGDDANNFNSQDIKDALAKTVSIGLLDTAYKLFKRGSVLNMAHCMYLLPVAASFYIANIGQRALRPEEGGFST